MKTILNKTRRPMKIPIPGGKFLHLGPAKTGQISQKTFDTPSVQRMIKAGELESIGEQGSAQSASGGGGPTHATTHGHPQKNVVLPKGNR